MQTPSSSADSAFDTLQRFFHDMHKWETEHYPKIRQLIETDAPQRDVESAQQQARDSLVEIYDKFGIVGQKNRNRIDGLSLSDPPTYEVSPHLGSRLEETDTSAIFLVKKIIGVPGNYRYTLKNKGGSWTLTKREFLDHEQKWRPFAF